jgi:hypothetical protein
MGSWPLRYLHPPRLPAGCKIVTFPGSPKPPDAIAGRWTENNSARPPEEHFKWALSQPAGKQRKKALHRYVQPCDWVKENWKP